MRPFSLLIKPAGPDCNINCQYCFYSCKSELFGQEKHRMSDAVLERIVSQFQSLDFPNHSYAWQGGEPTLMGLEFYEKVLNLQQKYAKSGQFISNAIQTNGILIDEKWCRFLHNNDFLVGISLDGPKPFHDHYRKDFAGRPTFDRVIQAINCCKEHKVEFNILTLLSDRNVHSPDKLFDFFVEQDFKFLQFIPCIETDPTGKLNRFSITDQQYGDFMCKIFDRWLEYGFKKVSIRLFDTILNYMLNGHHTNCTFCKKCDQYIVLEHNGNAYCCDFFVDDQHKLGNILETPIADLYKSPVKTNFSNSKNKLANKCFICRYSDLCRGGCLKDRLEDGDDIRRPSSLCAGYKKFFDHTLPKFQQIAADLIKSQA